MSPRVPSYVVGFLRGLDFDEILLLRKTNPRWQRGRLNGVGGKIEPQEEPIAAMRREWMEETASPSPDWRAFARLRGPHHDVWFFCASVDRLPKLAEVNDAGESFVLANYSSATKRADLIPNLTWLLPLAWDASQPFADVRDQGIMLEALR